MRESRRQQASITYSRLVHALSLLNITKVFSSLAPWVMIIKPIIKNFKQSA